MNPIALQDLVISQYHDFLGASAEAAESLPSITSAAAELIFTSLINDGKLLVCGENLHSINALQFCTRLNCSNHHEQPTLPVINLCADSYLTTAMVHSSPQQEIYAKQVNALGIAGDVLIVFFGLDATHCIEKAIQVAHQQGLQVLAIGSSLNEEINTKLHAEDIIITVPGIGLDSILQQQFTIALLLSQLVKVQLFGSNDQNA